MFGSVVLSAYCSPSSGPRAALTGSILNASELLSVAVFLDWQNSYRAAREAFGWEDYPTEYGVYSPYRLAQLLAAGNGRGANGNLVRLNIHRGLPSQKRDPIGYAANRRQSAAWMKENPEVVIPRLRPLRYSHDPDEPPREKGVDVELALSAVDWAITDRADVVIIHSDDTDLLPAIEMATRLKGTARVETASWTSDLYKRRLRPKPEVFHHDLTAAVFESVETRVNYAHPQ
jgi:NYN domain